MKRLLTIIAVAVLLTTVTIAQEKHRLVVLTDIENEPDDAQSMVRLLLYSNVIDIEALIATTSTHLRNKTAEWRIEEIITAYGKVQDNLLKHEEGFPSEKYLKSIIKKGIPEYGMNGVGNGMDSEGSDYLIEVVDRNDPRPVWVSVWGGSNVLAQSLYKVRQSRTVAELEKFVSKIRVYTISDQDDSGHWIRKEFPNLFYVVSPGGNYLSATWSGISGEPHYGFASGADTNLVKNPWLRQHIINDHGPLGKEYPEVAYAMEGDTPSFLGLIPNGLNTPGKPNYGGWGGRYELYTPTYKPYQQFDWVEPETRPIWTDAIDAVLGKDGRIYIDNHATIWRWRDGYQHDFAARMDWCTQSYKNANHPPEVIIDSYKEITVKLDEWVKIDASESTDPDNDNLSYRWIWYPEPGNFWAYAWKTLEAENTNKPVLQFRVPSHSELKKPAVTHFILEVTDDGVPALTRYARIIVNIIP